MSVLSLPAMILGGLVAFLAIDKFGPPHARTAHHGSEFRNTSVLIEDVSIGDVPIEINPVAIRMDFGNVFRREFVMTECGGVHTITYAGWRYCRARGFVSFVNGFFQIPRIGICSHLQGAKNFSVVGWSLAGVKYDKLGEKLLTGDRLHKSAWSHPHMHVCSKLSFSRFFSSIDKIISGFTEKARIGDQSSSYQYEATGQIHQPPFVSRMICAILGSLACFFLCGYGSDYKGTLKGAAFIVLGLLCGVVGVGLWWAVQFRSTWGWWL